MVYFAVLNIFIVENVVKLPYFLKKMQPFGSGTCGTEVNVLHQICK